MVQKIKNKADKNIFTITDRVQKLPIGERVKVISMMLSPEVRAYIQRTKKVHKLFKTIEDFWETNNDFKENEVERDIQSAVNFARHKLA